MFADNAALITNDGIPPLSGNATGKNATKDRHVAGFGENLNAQISPAFQLRAICAAMGGEL